MQFADVTLAGRGQIVIEKRVQLDLSRWVGKAVDDGLTTEQALAELRGRPVPWPEGGERAAPATKHGPARARKSPRA